MSNHYRNINTRMLVERDDDELDSVAVWQKLSDDEYSALVAAEDAAKGSPAEPTTDQPEDTSTGTDPDGDTEPAEDAEPAPTPKARARTKA